jgi:hypothetical protein
MKTSLLIISAAVILASACEVQAGMSEVYFPLNIGNSWTYTGYKPGPGDGPPVQAEYTFTIIGTEEIDGFTYYKFNDYFYIFPPLPNGEWPVTMGQEMLFRYDSISDRVIMRTGPHSYDYEIIRYDFTGGEWDSVSGWCRLKQSGITCNVPAGQFFDCINFQFGLNPSYGPDAATYGEYLAPDIGAIRYVRPGGNYSVYPYSLEGQYVTLELKSYTIIPEPSTILLFGLGTLLIKRKLIF